MTHEQRALAKSVQKVRGVLDRYPDGVTLSQITGDTQLSSGAARAALKHMGAECEDGLWFDVAVDEVEQSGNAGELEPEPVTIAESAPVEPVTIEPQPELKKLTQAVFDNLSPEYRWAAVDANTKGWAFNAPPVRKGSIFYTNDSYDSIFLGSGYDATDWRNSKIEREEVTVPDVMQCIANKLIGGWQEAHDKRQEQSAKSDFAVALEAERQRVFDAVANGGTVERLAEITGLPVDDVQMHLDVLIDDGAVVERPIIVAMSYRVAV